MFLLLYQRGGIFDETYVKIIMLWINVDMIFQINVRYLYPSYDQSAGSVMTTCRMLVNSMT